MKSDKVFLRRFGSVVYLLILAVAVILFLLAYYQLKDGVWHELLVNLSASFVGTALLFFLVIAVFRYDPQTQLLEEKLEQIRQDVNSLGGNRSQPFLIFETDLLKTSPFDIYIY